MRGAAAEANPRLPVALPPAGAARGSGALPDGVPVLAAAAKANPPGTRKPRAPSAPHGDADTVPTAARRIVDFAPAEALTPEGAAAAAAAAEAAAARSARRAWLAIADILKCVLPSALGKDVARADATRESQLSHNLTLPRVVRCSSECRPWARQGAGHSYPTRTACNVVRGGIPRRSHGFRAQLPPRVERQRQRPPRFAPPRIRGVPARVRWYIRRHPPNRHLVHH